ncbi:hypothetical protein IQ260_10980 [Leptolyngbya cf. ectocarpi LEGE 11479]|uniref:Uncharacterized protein n=1 Tax=Leptolyngbya cf. ectocarpi LEGE 11479 TaxID=1828722 RepID=A0A928X1C1_LEPEC|nr:hypothetical protein [Leptolyngbya ectocarpi]MBE9067179.1 hypothetical protein [Leptolyngbya cf. ectocarpi LEGE 11479]
MPKPRPKTTKRDPDAIAHVLDTVSDDAADLQPAAPKQVAKNKRTDYKKLLVYIPEHLHKALKREAFESDGELDMSDIIAQVLADRYELNV